MSIFQIIAVCFALFMAYTVNIHVKKKVLSELESSFWYSIWAGFIFIAFFPNILTGITDWLHFTRVFDFLTVCAFMLLSIVTFKNYFNYMKLEHILEKLIRQQTFQIQLQKHENKPTKN